jgi:hypothetical protein
MIVRDDVSLPIIDKAGTLAFDQFGVCAWAGNLKFDHRRNGFFIDFA